jgi:hypothetical protein
MVPVNAPADLNYLYNDWLNWFSLI